MGMLECICQVKSEAPHWEGPENEPFTNTLRNRFMNMSSVVALLCIPGLTMEPTVTHLGNKLIDLIGFRSSRGQVAAHTYQRQSGHTYMDGRSRVMIGIDWHVRTYYIGWLAMVLPKEDYIGSLLNFYRTFKSRKKKLGKINKNLPQVIATKNHSSSTGLKTQSTLPGPLWGRTLAHYQKVTL